MHNENDAAYQPDWASPPGRTILDIMSHRGIDSEELTTLLHMSAKNVRRLLHAEIPITSAIAHSLANALGVTYDFWMEREAVYQQDLQNKTSVENDWLALLPLKEMSDLGWIADSSENHRLETCLAFFGVTNVRAIMRKEFEQRIRYRTSFAFESLPSAVSAWIRQGEVEAEKVDCDRLNLDGFVEELGEIRRLTRIKDPKIFLPKVKERCARSGVVLVLLRAPTSCKQSGATFVRRDGTPVILLSGRHLSDDHLWFTFFHEAAHILLHIDEAPFLDEGSADALGKAEDEADQLAEDMIVPQSHRDTLQELRSHGDVARFATTIGISPGLIVGQMQNRGIIPHNWLNKLKRRYRWSNGELVIR